MAKSQNPHFYWLLAWGQALDHELARTDVLQRRKLSWDWCIYGDRFPVQNVFSHFSLWFYLLSRERTDERYNCYAFWGMSPKSFTTSSCPYDRGLNLHMIKVDANFVLCHGKLWYIAYRAQTHGIDTGDPHCIQSDNTLDCNLHRLMTSKSSSWT